MQESIIPEGEDLRRAVRWISEQGSQKFSVIQEASNRFDLSPKDEAFLIRHFIEKKSEGQPDSE